MFISEHLLVAAAKRLLTTEIAHSAAMKAAVASDAGHEANRPKEIERIVTAARQYRVPIDGRRVMDLGCSDGAISRGYLNAGAKTVNWCGRG
jgi:hypothetical protein